VFDFVRQRNKLILFNMVIRVLILLFFFPFATNCAVAQRSAAFPFRQHGLDVTWDRSGSNRIAYSSKSSDGYYDIHLADPEGSNDTCLTCNSPLLPNKHISVTDWYPNGKWLLIIAEKAAG
jgi:hypothetical protein